MQTKSDVLLHGTGARAEETGWGSPREAKRRGEQRERRGKWTRLQPFLRMGMGRSNFKDICYHL